MAENDLQKLAVDIEGMKKDIANASMFHSRLDTAIDKLTDVSTSIKQMLAVHEQKLTQTEKTEEILFDKVRERGEELDMVYSCLLYTSPSPRDRQKSRMPSSA